MEYIQENERTPKKDEGGINLRDVVELIIANWYWFVLSVLVCVGSAYFYVLTIQPVYQRQAVMLVKDKEKSASDMSAMLEVSGGITGTSVDNEIYILRSHQLLREVVNRLHLDVGYAKDGILRDAPLYAESPVEVHFIDPYNQPVSFNITPLNTTKFRISDWKVAGEKGRMQEQDLTYNDTIRTEAGRIVVQLRPENLSAYLSQPISVSRISPEIATNIYQSKIATSLAGERTTLVQITCSDTNISRADAILAALVKVYSETIIEDKNRIAANTAKFIDERISIISRELSDVEEDLTDFKQRNQIVDMSANATQYLAESSKIKEESAQLETELSIARSIKTYLADVTRKDQLIPNVTGVGDVSMQSQITAYNELMLQRNRLKESSGEKNPVVQAADKNLEGMRATISGSMDNYMKTLRLRLDKAKECLEAAGYSDSDGDGIVDKDGENLSLTISIANGSSTAVSETLQDMWKQIGVDVQIEMLENVSDKRASGDFDMLVSPNWQTVNAGDGQKYLMNRWSDGGSDNYSGYHSDEFQSVLDKLDAAFTQEDRVSAFVEAQQILADDAPAIWMYANENVTLVNSKIENVTVFPIDYYLVTNKWTLAE